MTIFDKNSHLELYTSQRLIRLCLSNKLTFFHLKFHYLTIFTNRSYDTNYIQSFLFKDKYSFIGCRLIFVNIY